MLPNLFHPFTGDPVEAGAPLSQAGERCPPFSSRAHTHTKRPMAYLVTYQNYNNTSEHSGALWSSMEPPLRSSLELCGALPSSLFLLKPLQVWCCEIHTLQLQNCVSFIFISSERLPSPPNRELRGAGTTLLETWTSDTDFPNHVKGLLWILKKM